MNSRTRRFISPRLTRLENRLAPALFTVSNTADAGAGSLRDAVAQANAAPGADTIQFSATGTITLTTGELAVNDALDIQGPGADKLTIGGNNASRIFSTATGVPLTLGGMRLTQGQAPVGGAIYAQGKLTIADSILEANTGTSFGGAVASTGLVVIQRSSISANVSATDGGGLIVGGLLLDDSTVSGNIAADRGGGIVLSSLSYSTFQVRNCTFSGNQAQRGAAIELGNNSLAPFDATLVLTNSTVARNVATDGGAVQREHGTGVITIESSIVGENQGSLADIASGGTVNVNYSAIGSPSGFTPTGGNNLSFGVDLKLAATLAFNGRAGATLMPALDSPVANKGSNPGSLTTDQRGAGFIRIQGGGIDIGAVEVPVLVVANNSDGGPGSLRQAIIEANSAPGADTITFDPLYFAVPRTISLSGGEMAIDAALSISGPGADKLTVDAQLKSRIFNTSGAANGEVIAFSGMTLTGGQSAISNSGGAIYQAGEDVTVRDCTLTGNRSMLDGGAIAVDTSYSYSGKLTVVSCQIGNNWASGSGGGLSITQLGTSVTILDSTIFSNTSQSAGGGVYALNVGDCLIRQSTFSGNSAVYGGAISFASLGVLQIQNSTIVFNSGDDSGGGIDSQGSVNLTSSIVYGNVTGSGFFGPDVFSANVTAIRSAIGTTAGITTLMPDATTAALLGQPLYLGPLADNGGGTLTHALLAGSPAIDAGSNPTFLTTDQRQAGYVRTFGLATDIGAFESQAGATVSNVIINGNAPQRSRVTSVAVVFDRVVNLPTLDESAFQLERQSDGLIVGLSASVAHGIETTVTLTFTGPNTESGSLLDGKYTLRVFAVQTNGGFFDANGDGTTGDDFVLIGDTTNNTLFRLFGDVNGDGFTDNVDLLALRTAIGSDTTMANYNPAFDVNADGFIDNVDLLAFRTRLGMTP